MRREMAIRGTHDCVMKVLTREVAPSPSVRVLDIGAGAGALSEKLQAAGFAVSACDFFPEQFDVPGVVCEPCDETGRLPFPDNQFDAALAIEVVEHIESHQRLFAEASRILKPGGRLLFSTPNILSLKSRMRFLLTGFFYSFGPLPPGQWDRVRQHVSPFTLNRYEWMLSMNSLRLVRAVSDKRQTTSLLLSFLVPVIWLASRGMLGPGELVRKQNAPTLLFGRKLVVVAEKVPAAGPADTP